MSYAIVGLVFVLLIVFGVLSSKHWHWLNIVFLILVFLAGAAACGAMAKSLKLRRDSMTDATNWEARATSNKLAYNEAINGSSESITYGRESLRGINELLTIELHGRGRVWSRGTPSFKGGDANDPNRMFAFSQARNAVNQANQMNGMLLYAFADEPVNGQPYPVTFVGTFRVVAETPEQIEIQPDFITSNDNYANPGGTSWSLFEKMPADRRDTFKNIPYENLNKTDLLGDNFDINEYRDALVNQHLPAAKFGLDPNSEEYERLIDRHLFDGMKLGDIANYIDAQENRKNVRFEPSPEEVFVQFRFDKKVDGEFDVDAPGSLGTGSAFQDGRAVDPALQAGKKIGFAKDETVIVDSLTADGYQRRDGQAVPGFAQQYPVTEIDRYYFRQMRDYPFMLADLQRQVNRFEQETTRAKANNEVTQESLDDALAQSSIRADIIVRLNHITVTFDQCR